MNFDWISFFSISAGSAYIAYGALRSVRDSMAKLLCAGFLLGFWFYSGIGAAYSEVSGRYIVMYFVFAASFALTYSYAWDLLSGIRHRILTSLDGSDSEAKIRGFDVVIFLYLFGRMIWLVYPENRLELILSPPSIDLAKSFFAGLIETERDPVLYFVAALNTVLEPFFYVALYRYRRRVILIFLLIFASNYLQYLRDAYIGRGTILTGLALIGFVVWTTYPKRRMKMAMMAVGLSPLLLYMAYEYSSVRVGGYTGELNPSGAISMLAEQEISFPRDNGMAVINSGKFSDTGKYITWLVTLPIPKIITGPIDGARLNHEMTTIITGVTPDNDMYSVALPGLLAEGYYVYGSILYWMHAVMLALLAVFVMSIVGQAKHFSILAFYVCVVFSYNLNRAGISSILFVLINGFLLFYFICFLTCRGSRVFKRLGLI